MNINTIEERNLLNFRKLSAFVDIHIHKTKETNFMQSVYKKCFFLKARISKLKIKHQHIFDVNILGL